MPTSLRDFHAGLYEEHLDEIAFLYQQRLALLTAAGRAWNTLAPIEDRLEAHLDALVVGGEHAMQIARRFAAEGEFGHLFGAVCLYCRQRDAQALAESLQNLDFGDAQKVRALADALKHESPRTWGNFIGQALARRDPRLAPMLATVAGHRRMHATAAALADAAVAIPAQARVFVSALGQLHAKESQPLLMARLDDADVGLQRAALLALLRCGLPEALNVASRIEGDTHWPMLPLALAAGRPLTRLLLNTLAGPAPHKDAVLALGLLGDPAALAPLLQVLEHEGMATSAAQALEWITGAGLEQQVFVPEEVDEALLFKHEIAAWQQYKQAPKRLDGQPFGETVQRLCVDRTQWAQWLQEHSTRFAGSRRYRLGQPVTPAGLIADLAQPGHGVELRRYTALELEIRYACAVPFEIDMPVAEQQRALLQMQAWLAPRDKRFEPGHWFYAGAVLPDA